MALEGLGGGERRGLGKGFKGPEDGTEVKMCAHEETQCNGIDLCSMGVEEGRDALE